uniref:Uncharacterized protein n=1 Tax=Setaria italica TaxID=4555 RepID=K3Z1Q1_SETIT
MVNFSFRFTHGSQCMHERQKVHEELICQRPTYLTIYGAQVISNPTTVYRHKSMIMHAF